MTLVELLVVVSIMALLIAILVPALVRVRNASKAFVCVDHVRAAAFEFRLFTDPYSRGDRGDSDLLYGNRFSAMDFLESLYETCEFWPLNGQIAFAREAYRSGQKPIICPSSPRGLYRVHGAPSIAAGGVAPEDRVSYAMNRRLIYAAVTKPSIPFPVQRFVTIGSRIMDHPHVPLMFDVDAAAAVAAREKPFFSAPPGRKKVSPSIYDDDRYWFPSFRHNGKVAVGFVGGHVVLTRDPLSDPSWDWDYHPEITSP